MPRRRESCDWIGGSHTFRRRRSRGVQDELVHNRAQLPCDGIDFHHRARASGPLWFVPLGRLSSHGLRSFGPGKHAVHRVDDSSTEVIAKTVSGLNDSSHFDSIVALASAPTRSESNQSTAATGFGSVFLPRRHQFTGIGWLGLIRSFLWMNRDAAKTRR